MDRYNTLTLTREGSYIAYVDKLRQNYAIRIEVKSLLLGSSTDITMAHNDVAVSIKTYLENAVTTQFWKIQKLNNYRGLHYVWFKHTEDALAFALKFNGKPL